MHAAIRDMELQQYRQCRDHHALVIVQVLAVSCYWFPVQAALAILVFNGIGEYAIAGYGVFTSYMMFMALLIPEL